MLPMEGLKIAVAYVAACALSATALSAIAFVNVYVLGLAPISL